jgi:hypothetical protein
MWLDTNFKKLDGYDGKAILNSNCIERFVDWSAASEENYEMTVQAFHKSMENTTFASAVCSVVDDVWTLGLREARLF